MLIAAVADRVDHRETTLQDAIDLLWAHPQVRHELLELFGILDDRIDHVHTPLTTHPDCPLQIHARYSRIEILAAFGLGSGAKIAAWQSGVYEAKTANAELLAFTLDKSSGGFSPTTRYRDYAISRNLIHWESQSITRVPTARLGCATGTTNVTGAASCCSPGSAPMTAPSGSSDQPPIEATSAKDRWRSPGNSNTRSRATCTSPSPQQSCDPPGRQRSADRRRARVVAAGETDQTSRYSMLTKSSTASLDISIDVTSLDVEQDLAGISHSTR